MQDFVSLDIETTADDERGSIISIGMVNLQTQKEIYFIADLSEGFFAKPGAFVVNGFDLRNPDHRFDSEALKSIDSALVKWLPLKSIAMGRGISYFDMKFIKKDLPMTFARFHRRLFDLWGFLFGLSQAMEIDPSSLYEAASDYAAKKIKKLNKDFPGWGPHHALYDAWENVYVLEYLIAKTKKREDEWQG